jgi:hypothetical protein
MNPPLFFKNSILLSLLLVAHVDVAFSANVTYAPGAFKTNEASDPNEQLKELSAQIQKYRVLLAEKEENQQLLQLLANAFPNKERDAAVKELGGLVDELKKGLQALEQRYELLARVVGEFSKKPTFLSHLKGFDALDFMKRLHPVMTEYQGLEAPYRLGKEAEARLIAVSSELFKMMFEAMLMTFEKDELKKLESHLKLVNSLEIWIAEFIQSFKVNVKGVNDVDTLIERIEDRLLEL